MVFVFYHLGMISAYNKKSLLQNCTKSTLNQKNLADLSSKRVGHIQY